ncbi:MAG TPA: SIR2 family protein [Candidatus Hydrogenedentes bacterium]|nr:SIR2 family protein [Candidatus Hydrogenedentota bacterium]HPG67560.1 SIR2 family protein [Candidatus Hydrogenedentota bacterium]
MVVREEQGRGDVISLAQGLKHKIGDQEVVLFLGAGVNRASANRENGPSWSDLLRDVLDHAVYYRLGGEWSAAECKRLLEYVQDSQNALSHYDQATLAKRLLGRHYLHAIREMLYRNVEVAYPTAEGTAPFLRLVANLCRKDQVRAVVTYNYDDFLECLLRSMGVRDPVSIYGRSPSHPKYTGPRAQIPIYHVHGFLPRTAPFADLDASGFVLCHEEYYRSLLEPFSWQTVQQLSFLRSYVCLYLGISLRDMNMLRLLCHSAAYASGSSKYILWCEKDIFQSEPPEGMKARLIAVRRSLCADLSLELVCCGPEYEDLYAVLGELGK